jgi:hypothetical protein
MLEGILSKRRIRIYNDHMSAGRYDQACVIAAYKGLGEDLVRSAAVKWYGKLIEERNPSLAREVAEKMEMPRAYVEHARVEELILRARDMEESAGVLLETAREYRQIAMRMESGGFEWQSESSELDPPKSGGAECGKMDRKSLKYKVGLLLYEKELASGNRIHAAMIANSYGIRREDRDSVSKLIAPSKD